MAYESWSQVVIRTILEWEKRKAELKSASVISEKKSKVKRKRSSA